MTFSAEGLRRRINKIPLPMTVLAEKGNAPCLTVDKKQLLRLIDAGAVYGWGSQSRIRGMRLCTPGKMPLGSSQLATLDQVSGLPCCGDPSKAFTLGATSWRQWPKNPAPRVAANMVRNNNGGSRA